jgi:hypothetical protein
MERTSAYGTQKCVTIHLLSFFAMGIDQNDKKKSPQDAE